MNRVLLLTGRPGVGKTTVIRRLAELCLTDADPRPLKIAGFYTAEERGRSGERTGFMAHGFSGAHWRIASVRRRGEPRVSKYGVDVPAVDALTRSELTQERDVDLHLIDEIGKMECYSADFVRAVRALMASGKPVVATVGHRGGGFIGEARSWPGGELWIVTSTNRDVLSELAHAWLRARAPRRWPGRAGR